MLAVVEITDEPVPPPRSFQSKDGRPFRFWSQKMYLHNGGQYPEAFEFLLDEARGPYPPGKYLMGGASFERDRKLNALVVKRQLFLVSVSDAVRELKELEAPSFSRVKAAPAASVA